MQVALAHIMICGGGSTSYLEVGFDPFDISHWVDSFGGLVVLLPAFHVAFVVPSTSTPSYFSCCIRDCCVIVAVAARVAPAKHGLPSPLVVVVVVVVIVVVVVVVVLVDVVIVVVVVVVVVVIVVVVAAVIIVVVFVVVGACFVIVCARSIPSSYHSAKYCLIVVSSMSLSLPRAAPLHGRHSGRFWHQLLCRVDLPPLPAPLRLCLEPQRLITPPLLRCGPIVRLVVVSRVASIRSN